MKKDNPFDKAIGAQSKIPETTLTAITNTTDLLDLAWKAAQAVFETQAKPEHALALLPTFIEQRDAERRRLQESVGARTADA